MPDFPTPIAQFHAMKKITRGLIFYVQGVFMTTEEDRSVILHISDTLDKILDVLTKPQNKLVKIFEIVATGIAILGILTVIDVIKNWLGG
jgi:preprotein translocase subunit Sss1